MVYLKLSVVVTTLNFLAMQLPCNYPVALCIWNFLIKQLKRGSIYICVQNKMGLPHVTLQFSVKLITRHQHKHMLHMLDLNMILMRNCFVLLQEPLGPRHFHQI